MYYINPWVFYIIGLISNIQCICVLFAAVGSFCGLLAILLGPEIIDEATNTTEEGDRFKAVFWKWMKRLPLALIVSLVVAVTVPSEETMYKMMIASKISTNDVDHVIERLDEVVDAIIESRSRLMIQIVNGNYIRRTSSGVMKCGSTLSFGSKCGNDWWEQKYKELDAKIKHDKGGHGIWADRAPWREQRIPRKSGNKKSLIFSQSV